jgi:hypothetical protein
LTIRWSISLAGLVEYRLLWPPAHATDALERILSGELAIYCQPGILRISGRWWAMPLWQSMQVFSPGNKKRWCATEARGDCLVMSIDAAL